MRLTASMLQAAEEGLDMNDALARPLTERYQSVPIARAEYRRSVVRLFRKIEDAALAKGGDRSEGPGLRLLPAEREMIGFAE